MSSKQHLKQKFKPKTLGRIKVMKLAPPIFMYLFTQGSIINSSEVIKGAPKDARLVNVRMGWGNYVEVLLESQEFEEVPEGDIIPELEVIMQRKDETKVNL